MMNKIPKRLKKEPIIGLKTDSVIVADNLATILNREIDRVIGHCPKMQAVDYALKLTLGLNHN